MENANLFRRNAGMKRIVALADGSLIHVKTPVENEPAYVDRNNHHSINVQVSKTVLLFGTVHALYKLLKH